MNEPLITFDMHLHTSRHSPDGQSNPFSLARHAWELGLTGIIITEHDWLWCDEELDELRAATPGLQIYSGVEVSAYEGHFLCYGITDPMKLSKGIALKDLCTEVHAQGGAIIAAHPYRWGQNFDEILAQEPLIDGLELMSSNMDAECKRKARAVHQARTVPWSAVGNSDAHQLEVVACCYTVFPQAIRDQADLLEALRSGQTVPRERLPMEVKMMDD